MCNIQVSSYDEAPTVRSVNWKLGSKMCVGIYDCIDKRFAMWFLFIQQTIRELLFKILFRFCEFITRSSDQRG